MFLTFYLLESCISIFNVALFCMDSHIRGVIKAITFNGETKFVTEVTIMLLAFNKIIFTARKLRTYVFQSHILKVSIFVSFKIHETC